MTELAHGRLSLAGRFGGRLGQLPYIYAKLHSTTYGPGKSGSYLGGQHDRDQIHLSTFEDRHALTQSVGVAWRGTTCYNVHSTRVVN